MKEIKKVLICGLGAIGTIYADKIQKFSNDNLKILVDEKRLERYIKNPIIFNGEEKNFNYILPENKDFKADLIIIATKYDGIFDVIKNIKNFVTENTIIMSLLNGVTSEKLIAEEYGFDKLVYSYFIGHSAVREGRNITQDGINTIVFGSDDNPEHVKAISSFFDKAGINYKIPEDIIRSMWLKYMLNVSSNQTSAILKLTFGDIYNNEKCLNFIIEVMKEVQTLAKAEGVNNTESMIDEALITLKTMTFDGKTSMLQDVEAGRKTEVEMFAGNIIELGKKHNIATPYNNVLKQMIDIIYEIDQNKKGCNN